MWRSNMNKNILNAIQITALILVIFLFAGCGDSEIAKGITDVVKKSVEGEVNKKAGEIKKQFDQVINLGTGKGQKENGAADEGKEKSGKDSDRESAEED
jgi:hypothetical protein